MCALTAILRAARAAKNWHQLFLKALTMAFLLASCGSALNSKKGKSVGILARKPNFCTCGLNFLLLFTGLPPAVQPYSIKCIFGTTLGTVIDIHVCMYIHEYIHTCTCKFTMYDMYVYYVHVHVLHELYMSMTYPNVVPKCNGIE